MKRIEKSKKGFTLVEMLLVIAIIVVLAAATSFGINSYIVKSNEKSDMVNEHNDANDRVQSDINALVH